MNTKATLLYFLLIVFTFSCSRNKAEEINNTSDGFTSNYSANIIQQGRTVISNEIDIAISNDTSINFESIKSEINKIEGVKNCLLNDSNTVLFVNDENSVNLNLIIFDKSDQRFYNEEAIRSDKSSSSKKFFPPIKPYGDAKAIILAPFQSEFNEDIDHISKLFENAGYHCTIYRNKEVTLDRIRGDFLSSYDIVYISTHGSSDATIFQHPDKSSAVISIAKNTQSNNRLAYSGLTKEEKATIAMMGTSYDNANFAVSPEWFRVTTTSNFKNSWIYLSACQSTAIRSGSHSFSNTFLDLGAAGVNGFSSLIAIPLSEAISEKATALFTSGVNFTSMHEKVINDTELIVIESQLKNKISNLFQWNILDVDLFTADKQISDPFYLILPEDLVGTATLSPNSGPKDTEAIFKVVINPDWQEQVTRITFDIDNTGQSNLVMNKINNTTWEYTDLTAPDGVYPRIDTFTFTAFNSENQTLGKGSAVFSFESSTIGKTNSRERQQWSQ